MFVIGRNVEVKVEDGKLTIECRTKDVTPVVSISGERLILATTIGPSEIPKTDLSLLLCLYRQKTE